MIKVLDKALEKDITGIIKGHDEPKDAATEVVAFLKKTQDASGMKVCMVITE